MARSVADYLDLPYTIELRKTPDEGWFVRVKELPGCMSQGETAEEALAMIQDAMRGWLEVVLEHGDPIPEPRPEEEYSIFRPTARFPGRPGKPGRVSDYYRSAGCDLRGFRQAWMRDKGASRAGGELDG